MMYVKAKSAAEALAALAQAAGRATIIAGGSDLMVDIQEGKRKPEMLVDITAAADMRQIRVEGDELVIGAAATLTEIARSPLVQQYFPSLCQGAGNESNRSVSAEIDASRLSLAFSNLVENAIKYNNENGWVRVTLDADHKFFYVKVSDSGMGIPQESLDYIFERFYRVDKSHSREIGGTGLGLAITKSAVVAHRGAIKVQSKLGEGTTFTVRIPLRYIV